jgi:acyl carrier protein
MNEPNQIEQIVFNAIDRVNEVLLDENAAPKKADTILLGQGAVLDSMGFINFVVALEDELAVKTGLNINLAEKLNAQADNALKPATVGEFIAFLIVLVKTKSAAGKES